MKYRIIVDSDGEYEVQRNLESGLSYWHTVSIHETKQDAITIMDELIASARAASIKKEAYDKLVAEGRHIVVEETV